VKCTVIVVGTVNIFTSVRNLLGRTF